MVRALCAIALGYELTRQVTIGRQTFMSEGSQESSRHEVPARAEV